MDVQGRAQAVTVISPIRPWWALWLQIAFRLLRRAPQPPLLRLAFIHIAHWSPFGKRLPGDRARGRGPLPYHYLIFNSNFNGDLGAYIDAFALVVPWRMRLIWHGIYGFPGPRAVDRFVEFVRKHANPVQHYYCAYPKASAKMVAQALALEARHDQLAQQAGTVDDAAFDAKWRAFVTDNQELLAGGGEPQERPGTVPSTLVVLARVRGEDARQLEQELADLEGKESPFAHMSGTHFARLAFVPALCGPDDELLDSEGPFLLLAADFDGELREWAAELCGKAGAALDPILRCWEGFPGVGDPVKVAKFLISRNAPPGLTFAGYHATVPEVLKAVRLCGKLRALAVRAQNERLGPAALRQAWQSDVRDAA